MAGDECGGVARAGEVANIEVARVMEKVLVGLRGEQGRGG